MGTPIRPEQNYPLNESLKNNDANRPEIKKYIINEINWGSKESQNCVNYQYNNMFSPFYQVDSTPPREPLGCIPQFSLQRKLAYTQWAKENRKDFSFAYGENNDLRRL